MSVFKPQADAKNIKLDFQVVKNLPSLASDMTDVPKSILDDSAANDKDVF